jgi:hypothetical protein
MVKMIDLQDNLTKTVAVERIAQSERHKPDNDQRQFLQTVQQAAQQQHEATEPMIQQDHVELNSNKEKPSERQERQDKQRKKRQEKEQESVKSSEHLIDIKV